MDAVFWCGAYSQRQTHHISMEMGKKIYTCVLCKGIEVPAVVWQMQVNALRKRGTLTPCKQAAQQQDTLPWFIRAAKELLMFCIKEGGIGGRAGQAGREEGECCRDKPDRKPWSPPQLWWSWQHGTGCHSPPWPAECVKSPKDTIQLSMSYLQTTKSADVMLTAPNRLLSKDKPGPA